MSRSAGLGGVGGVHLITLARMGIGKFTIADPDIFDVANFNRQYGATISNLGRNKAEVMAQAALDINPELELRVLPKAVDAIECRRIPTRRRNVCGWPRLFRDRRRDGCYFAVLAEHGIWAVTAGPIGFSTAWLAFDPAGMKFDEYFDLTDSMEQIDKLASFAVGLTPKATQVPYTDLLHASLFKETGPCSSIGCELAAGVVGTDALKLLLKRGEVGQPSPITFNLMRTAIAL